MRGDLHLNEAGEPARRDPQPGRSPALTPDRIEFLAAWVEQRDRGSRIARIRIPKPRSG